MNKSKTLFGSTFLFIFGLVVTGPAVAQFSGAVPPPEDLKAGYDSITAEQSKAYLSVLASEEFEGRGTGQVGYTKAAHWVAGKIAEYGFEPIGDGGTYFQMLNMSRLTVDMEHSSITGPNNLKITGEDSFGAERFAGQATVTGNVVFINIKGGSTALDQDLELREKIVIYVTDEAAQRRAPFLIARKRPLAAFRVIDGKPKVSSQIVRDGGRQRSTSVSGTINKKAAGELLAAVDGKEKWLEQAEEDGVAVNEVDKEVTVELRIREAKASIPNVVGWLEGSDPDLKHEYIVIGSHLDHLGLRGGSVYPGADDNGSGSTAVLNIARAMSLNPKKPKRSVLFIWFAAEEIGLVGSRHYCDNPIRPLEDMICMFNIDMVGRNEETENEPASENENTIHLIGSEKRSSELHEVILDANKHVDFTFEYDQESVFGRSDQANFHNKGIAVAFLFGGFHPDYHKPSDLKSKINYDKIAAAAKLFYLSINLASEHGRFKPDPPSETAESDKK